MPSDSPRNLTRIVSLLLWLIALLFICYAVFYPSFLSGLATEWRFRLYPIQLICIAFTGFIVVVNLFVLPRQWAQRLLANEWTINGLLSIVSVFFFLTFLELALRPFAHFGYRDAAIYQPADELEWELKPSIEVDYGGVTVRTNSLGMRGDESEVVIPEGSARYLFLGDSVAFGLRLPYKNTIPVSVEQRFIESGVSAQSLNAGVPGYSVYQSRVALENKWGKLHPDVIVFCFVLNDVLPTYTAERFGDFGADNPAPYIQTSVIDWVHQNSSIAYMIKKGYYQLRFGKTLHQSAVYQEQLDVQSLVKQPAHDEVEKAWKAVGKNLDLMKTWCDENGAKFVILLFPYKFQLASPDKNQPQEKMIAIAGDKLTLDLLPLIVDDMKAHDRKAEDYFMDFCHPTAWGAGWMADPISEFLLSNTHSGENAMTNPQ